MEPFSNEAYYLLFSALANRTRLAIIDSLKGGPKTISEISKALEQQQELIAYNLEPLQKCMIVKLQKSGEETLYSLVSHC